MVKIILLAISTLLISCKGEKIVKPVFLEKVQGSVIYEQFAPIHFTVFSPLNLTRNDALLAAFGWSTSDPCTSSTGGAYHCPVTFSMQKARDSLTYALRSDMDKTYSPLPSKVDQECSEISEIFSSVDPTKNVFDETRNQLLKCLNETLLEPVFHDDRNDGVYEEAFNAYRTTLNPDINTDEGKRSATNAASLLNVAGFLHHSLTTSRFREAVQECRNLHVLPALVISDEALLKLLTKLEESVAAKGYKLAISKDDPTPYWSLQTADCAITDLSVLNVIASVPLIRSESVWEEYKVTRVPFRTEFENVSYICYEDDPEFESGLIYYDSFEKIAYPQESGKTGKGVLRHVSRRKSHSQSKYFLTKDETKSCASKVIEGVDLYFCELTCAEENVFNEQGLGIAVKQVTSDTFYIVKTSKATGDLVVNCSDPENPVRNIAIPDKGALELQLGSKCHFFLGSMKIMPDLVTASENGVNFEVVKPIQIVIGDKKFFKFI